MNNPRTRTHTLTPDDSKEVKEVREEKVLRKTIQDNPSPEKTHTKEVTGRRKTSHTRTWFLTPWMKNAGKG